MSDEKRAALSGESLLGELSRLILNDTNQMIQLADLDTMTMLYANRPALEYAVHSGEPYEGRHCYEYMMGLDAQCPFCPLRRMNGGVSDEGEVDNGREIYAFKTRVTSWNGRQAFVEYVRNITELRRAEKVFAAQTRTLMNAISDAQGIFRFDVTEGRCLSVSGVSRNISAIRQDSMDAAVESMAAFVPDEETRRQVFAAFCREAMQTAYARGDVQVVQETDSFFDDGSIRSVRLTARLAVNPTTGHLECVLYGMDISDEKRKQAEYEAYIRQQLSVFDALGRDYLNICLIDMKRGRVSVLKSAQTVHVGFHDVRSDEIYDQRCAYFVDTLVVPEDREEMRKAVKLERVAAALAEAPEYSFTYRADVRGQRHDCQMKFLRMAEPDQAVMTVRYIDELVAAERERQATLEKAMAAAEQAYIAAEHANQAKTTFLNSMSHDIRTPMNAILGFTALASTHVHQPEIVTDYLGKIMSSSNHLLSLINDVLDMSRIESGKMKIEERECNLSVVIHDLRNMLQADIRDKRLDLFIDTVDVMDENVICDRLRLNQILINILSNAIKFTNPGGAVSLRIIQKENAPEDYADFDFIVRDNGIGMSEEFAKHIFEPFTREENSAVSRIPGTGLGMAITKNLVEMMNGQIAVKSELGKGSEFTVSFRFLRGSHTARKRGIKSLEGFRALVADDSTDSCVSTSKMLKVIGMRPDWTTSGKEAVIRARVAYEENDAYKVYIIDWLMPDMNGVETVRRIRKEIGSDAAIIILTAYDWSDIETEAREAGVTAFCAKPLFLSELYSVLQETSCPTAPAEETPDFITPDEFRGRRVLLVDDVELNREIAEAILNEAGVEVECAENGADAVHILTRAKPGRFDLVLMDVMMPVMDGYEATRRIRRVEDPRISGIPIIAMTANAFEEDRQAALAAGMNEHLAKPFRIEDLRDVMRKFIK